MNKRTTLGLVIGGYAAAYLVAGGMVYLYQLFTENAAAQASSGMYAFGDFLLFLGVFGILALLPTGLTLYYLVRWFR